MVVFEVRDELVNTYDDGRYDAITTGYFGFYAKKLKNEDDYTSIAQMISS